MLVYRPLAVSPSLAVQSLIFVRDRENESFSNDWEDHLFSGRIQENAAWSLLAHLASVWERRASDFVLARKPKRERSG